MPTSPSPEPLAEAIASWLRSLNPRPLSRTVIRSVPLSHQTSTKARVAPECLRMLLMLSWMIR